MRSFILAQIIVQKKKTFLKDILNAGFCSISMDYDSNRHFVGLYVLKKERNLS